MNKFYSKSGKNGVRQLFFDRMRAARRLPVFYLGPMLWLVSGCAAGGLDQPSLPQIGNGETASPVAEQPQVASAKKKPLAVDTPRGTQQPITTIPSTPSNDRAVTAGPGLQGTTTINNQIVGFNYATVVLFDGARSNNGRRVPATSLQTPIKVPGGYRLVGSRIPIATVDGVRWISRKDVKLQ